MSFWEIVLLGLALSMDACAVAMTNGMTDSKMPWKRTLLIGVFFGFFQFLMPVTALLFCIEAADLGAEEVYHRGEDGHCDKARNDIDCRACEGDYKPLPGGLFIEGIGVCRLSLLADHSNVTADGDHAERVCDVGFL